MPIWMWAGIASLIVLFVIVFWVHRDLLKEANEFCRMLGEEPLWFRDATKETMPYRDQLRWRWKHRSIVVKRDRGSENRKREFIDSQNPNAQEHWVIEFCAERGRQLTIHLIVNAKTSKVTGMELEPGSLINNRGLSDEDLNHPTARKLTLFLSKAIVETRHIWGEPTF